MSNSLHTILTAPARPRIFISFHHENDQGYYDEFSRFFSDNYEAVRDNSVDRINDSDNPEYVMRRIREDHITGTSCTIVLCGAETYKRKYVDWEIKATLDKSHGLIGVNLPTSIRGDKGGPIVPGRLYDNITSSYAIWIQWTDLAVDYLKRQIVTANNQSYRFINNSRSMKKRNG